ncbi:MAG TPA: TldD/PmbA family protein [Thermodesulfovibrionales bacterium]|nr:TldD/PmbA family protein [Thermodesulfovibrionales bacterium]
MLDVELLSKVVNKALSRGGEYADVFVEHRNTAFIHLEDEKIEKVVSGVVSGVGIRLVSNGKTFYAFGNDASETSLMEIADTLSKALCGTVAKLSPDMRKARPGADLRIERYPTEVPVSEKIGHAKKADRVARSFDRRIRQVSVSYRDSAQKIQVATSEGILAHDERIHTLFAVHVIASDGGVVQTGFEMAGGHIGFELFDNLSVEELSLAATRRAVMMLGAGKAPGGRMPVVISSEAGGTMIHEAIGHGLEADLAQRGLSAYSGKEGMEVASKLVTVIDDATLPHRRGSYGFDDEGTPSQRTVLVDKGILKGFMYDRLTAMRESVKSTGNGRRESYQHRPIPRMTNTFIAPGDAGAEEIVRSVPQGLFVKKMGGGQVNTVSGDFVFEVQEGYRIENGAVGPPVREATLTGNGPDVLKSIDMIASDLGFSIGTCGKDSQGVPVSDAMPTIRIREMVVGGEIRA